MPLRLAKVITTRRRGKTETARTNGHHQRRQKKLHLLRLSEADRWYVVRSRPETNTRHSKPQRSDVENVNLADAPVQYGSMYSVQP